ncbi:MAG: RodZ domain-containing protein [Spirochaeta sp.]
MESIGEKLARARNNKGYSLDQVARDTHISPRYIEAIELENFEIFPGETYLLGFIRKYADFLGVDPQEMVNLYKNQQLQEQPPPIQELLNPRFRVTGRMVAAGVAIGLVVVAAAAGILMGAGILNLPQTASSAPSPSDESQSNSGRTVHLTQNFLEQRFRPGDIVSVPVEGVMRMVEIADINGGVTLSSRDATEHVGYLGEALLDITGDDLVDIRVRVVDDARRSDGSVVLRIDRTLEGPERAAIRPGSEPVQSQTAAIGSTSLESRTRRSQIIREASAVEPVQIQVRAEEVPVLVRLQANGQDTPVQQVLAAGEDVQLEGSEYVQVYLANAGAAEVLLNGEPVELGEDGEVRVVRYAWRNIFGPGTPRLEQVPVY